MTDILMPNLSDSMEEGTILSWLKATGDEVTTGDELLEIETDKATITYTAENAGRAGDPDRRGDDASRSASRSLGSSRQPQLTAPAPPAPSHADERAAPA